MDNLNQKLWKLNGKHWGETGRTWQLAVLLRGRASHSGGVAPGRRPQGRVRAPCADLLDVAGTMESPTTDEVADAGLVDVWTRYRTATEPVGKAGDPASCRTPSAARPTTAPSHPRWRPGISGATTCGGPTGFRSWPGL